MSKAISEKKKVSKKLAVLLAVLVAVLAASYALHHGPALAQEKGTKEESPEKKSEQEKDAEAAGETEPAPKEGDGACPAVYPVPEWCNAAPQDPPPGPPTDTFETFSFELAVEGTPPAGARFFGSVPSEGGIGVPLTDPDGDGNYAGSMDVPKFPPGPVPPGAKPVDLPVRIVQTTGQTSASGPEARVIKDFGLVPVDEDKTFEADVSFEDGGEKPEQPGDEVVLDILVEATGVLEEQGITTYQYGTHTITDEASGTLYALKSNTIDLDSHAGERVAVSGGLVKGYENGQIEGGPPLVKVTDVRPADEPGGETVKVTFELAVEEEVPPVHDLVVTGDLQGVPEGSFGAVLCTTDRKDGQGPACEKGGVYSKTYDVPAGTTVSYRFHDRGYTRSYGTFLTGQKAFYEDATVRATYPPPVEPPPEPGTTTPDPGSGGSGGSGGGFLSSTVDGVRGLLPSTGGLPLALLIAGAVLIPGGLLIRKLAR